MVSTVRIVTFFHILLILLSSEFGTSKAQTWVRAGYHRIGEFDDFETSDINSALFTHLICGFAVVNSTSYELSLTSFDKQHFSNFTGMVKLRNPSVSTLLSIGGFKEEKITSTFSSLASNSSYRKAFIDSSIKVARLYGFQGLDLSWSDPNTSSDMSNLGLLLGEWRAAISLEASNTNRSELILTAMVHFSPRVVTETYPIDAMQKYLNWVHIRTQGYKSPATANFTSAHAALYDPTRLSAKKLVMFMPYYGYAWTLVNSMDNGIGAPASRSATTETRLIEYQKIRSDYIGKYGAMVLYNATYVVNYCAIETTWIGYDDVEAIQTKVSYAKEKGLLGYVVWQVSYDNNWVLSQAAADQHDGTNSTAQHQDSKSRGNKRPFRLLVIIILPTTATLVLLLGLVIYLRWMRKLKSKCSVDLVQGSRRSQVNNDAAAGDFSGNAHTLVLYSLADIEAATDKFSMEYRLGEGGYGPVYKGVLHDGQEVAVKKLSKTSTQGFEEFKNEKEHMLIYEYMSNKSLDYYLFDPIKKYTLDWEKRIHIIEGVCQGLTYLQEYSRLTIIHRDLKASNVLLDENMKPKISDFGMARIFTKDNGLEANTERIVGTYGYAPPKYVKRGIYSTKSDIYSFGVLLLQIISGKRVSILYGENHHLSLLGYAYKMWKDGKGMEFMDPSLDDTYSRCRLIRLSMLEISWMLKNEATDLMTPNKPGFSRQNDHDDQEDVQYDSTTSNLEIGSVNDATVSNLEAR
ncbi:hypothetical protein ACOSQ3_012629 [Xanthoceras sorbifolium]